METLISGLVFLAILSVVVLIHELGHLMWAKRFGVFVEEFGFGFPPRVMKLFKKGETIYSLNLLPIGGFVKLYGEDREERTGLPDNRAFWSKSILQRLMILVGGVLMNFLLGVALFAGVYSYMGIPTETRQVGIDRVESGSPAEKAGVLAGDVITELSAGGESLAPTDNANFRKFLYRHQGEEIELRLKRGGEEVSAEASLTKDESGENWVLGVALAPDMVMKKYPLWQAPIMGAWVGLKEAVLWGYTIVSQLTQTLVQVILLRKIPEGLAGPVGIYQITDQVRKTGLLPTLHFAGVLSINLAILNILPIPAMDGGRVVFLLLEKLRGKKVKDSIEYWVNMGGFVVLIGLMVLISINDVMRIVAK